MPRMELNGKIVDLEVEPRKIVLFHRKWLAGQMRENVISLHVEAAARIVSGNQEWLQLEDLRVGQQVMIMYQPDKGNNVAHEIIVLEDLVQK